MSSSPPARSKHLPYTIEPGQDRFSYYEVLWKKVGLELLLRHQAPSSRSVLDYGCGRGEGLQLFSQAGFVVTGTDVDPECVKLSSRYGRAVPLQPDKPLEQFGPRSFDVVACFHVLEHVPCPRDTLAALAGIAREYVIVAVPNLRYLHRLFERRFDLSHVNEGHLQSWDHWHFLNLAHNYCGLDLVEWGSDATVLPLISNLSQKLLGRRITIQLETGLFRWVFPYHCISVLGLFRPRTR
jgi:SAM-dependent methyltransferase